MYTAQFLRNLGHLTPQWDAHCGAWLHGGMHTAESDYSTSKMSVFVFSNSWRLSITFYRKTSELKKIPLTIFDFQYNFHSNSLRHHREITIVKFRIKLTFGKLLTSRCASHRRTWLRGMKDTAESDSRVWCTLRSFLGTFFYAHRGAWLLCMMHTTKLFKKLNISAKWKPNSKIL